MWIFVGGALIGLGILAFTMLAFWVTQSEIDTGVEDDGET